MASGVSGIINLACTIPAQVWVDKWGRKFPLIGGGIAMSLCYFCIGLLYLLYGEKVNGEVYINSKVPQWAVIILIYLFIGNFAWSWAVVSVISLQFFLLLTQSLGHQNLRMRNYANPPPCKGMRHPAGGLCDSVHKL